MVQVAPDTPDYQQGVVNAQKLLATVAGGTGGVTVGAPPNCQSLLIVTSNGDSGINFNVSDEVTGYPYPAVRIPNIPGLTSWGMTIATVSPALGGDIIITGTAAPVDKWYVIGDAGVRGVIDVASVTSIGTVGVEVPGVGRIIGGSDSQNFRQLRVDSNGYLVPLTPGKTTGYVTCAAGAVTNLLGAAVSGQWYIYSIDCQSDSGAGTAGIYTSSLASPADAIALLGTSTNRPVDHVDMMGYRTSTGLWAGVGGGSQLVKVTYANAA